MTRDQAFEAAEEEWESMTWRERVAALDEESGILYGPKDDRLPVDDWLDWMDKPRPPVEAGAVSFEAFLYHLAHEEWIPARAEYLYTEAQADEADRLYDMKKEEGW